MTPVLPASNICYFASVGNASFTRKYSSQRNCSVLRKQSVPQRFSTPLSISPSLFSPFTTEYIFPVKLTTRKVTAAGTDVAVEEVNLAVNDDKESGDLVGSNTVPTEASEDTSTKPDVGRTSSQPKQPRGARKSDMPPIKNEDLVAGATFTGKVRSILPFGAFVDFGAFTDGLVHVSQLSDSFVKDVKDVVSVGQEVTVRLVEVNTESKRISLTMRNSDETNRGEQQKNKGEQQKRGNTESDKPRSPRTRDPQSNQKRNETRKSSKFVLGQELEGTVKNLTRAGAFISLPEGEEGFLPTSEEAADGFGNVMGGTSLQTGQEVKVRVLRFSRGQVTLTMKDKDEAAGSDTIINPAVMHTATNPFVLAFRNNKDISAFLDKQQKEKEPTLEVLEDAQAENNAIDKVGSPEIVGIDEGQEGILTDALQSVQVEADAQVDAGDKVGSPEIIGNFESQKDTLPDASQGEEVVVDAQVDAGDKAGSPEIIGKHEGQIDTLPDASQDEEVVVNAQVDASDEVGSPELIGNHEAPKDTLPDASQGEEVAVDAQIDTSDKVGSPEIIGNHESQVGIIPDASQGVEAVVDATDKVGSPEIIANPESQVASISPSLVKQLREETGAGMMDCKKALSETGGDIVKAQEYLRKKGLASADKKASRTTAEGRVGSYIHDSRIGVLIEVNCETDFVARGDIFKELVDDLAMQVAACSQVQYINTDEIPKDIVNKEREIEMQKEDLLSKPEQIRSRIVDGRIQKRLDELALLEQPFIKNDKTVVKDLVKQTIATIGENIKVKRFARYVLGEGLEKKSQDFAAEVAAQTTAKAPAPGKDQSSTGDAKETVEKSNQVTVSAVLVKQLRDETGAGMMDCKKALSETGGDLEKAQEYLRKKGLSAADKKSSRLAAEGRIGSYIHDSRIGVLIEVNCETDFVGRSEKFKELVDDLAMQIVACPQVQYVTLEDIPAEIINREKEFEMQREDLQSKPENIREKIVEGRVSKRLGELVLLEQAFIKDDSVLVKDIVKQSVAAIGENIKVRRFVRFTLGEETDTNKAGE